MAYMTDIAASVLIAGFLFLVLITLDVDMEVNSRQLAFETMAQESSMGATEILEYDLLKMGYRAKTNPIAIAESSQVKFYTDIDNNGKRDSVRYYLVTTNGEKSLYRVLNGFKGTLCGSVKSFKFTYYDSLGVMLDYALLKSSAATRNLVRSVTTEAKFDAESDYSDNRSGKNYITVVRSFKPKSLKR